MDRVVRVQRQIAGQRDLQERKQILEAFIEASSALQAAWLALHNRIDTKEAVNGVAVAVDALNESKIQARTAWTRLKLLGLDKEKKFDAAMQHPDRVTSETSYGADQKALRAMQRDILIVTESFEAETTRFAPTPK